MSETGKIKIALFRDKLDSILKVYKGEKEYDNLYPISVELSLTNVCNQKCVWCCDSTIRSKYPGHADRKILFGLIKDIQEGGTKGVTIEGGGEPTMHPDFEEIIQRISKSNMAVGLFSNGLNIEKVTSIIDCFEWIRISLDADNADTFERYKGTDGFQNVMNNIEELVKKSQKTIVSVGYVATRYNLKNIADIVKRLRGIGVDYFYIRPVEDNPRYASCNNMEWLKKYASDNFDVVVNYYDRIKRGNLGLPCLCHSIVTVISADASVYICGRLHIYPRHQAIGSLKEESFFDIWNGKKRIKFTKLLLNSNYTLKNCPVCRITKYNDFVREITNIKTANFI